LRRGDIDVPYQHFERAIALGVDDCLFKEDIMHQLCTVVDYFLRPAELPRD
jgi:hypothetical protein